ncbi:alternate-type signal peptide domain-containing protein [Salinibacterium sp. SWN139]|uniref:alternate-type signal peptide domain-containing protein n=1 Tax=Salinibacterium sp. SWN139 TaxID=2792055 RepID=UPI0018CFA326|nr:alternate-type signal peptide domain-containing protein [Salinibacterium sp. SWN139]MBH0053252.1 alternate-type signal peptide domain-containing protein [Salinibacterium sp. SWN139]
MNKLVKGSIAGAAGIALLLGGAGTLATWNSSVTVASPGSIAAGTLDIAAGSGSTDGWKLGTAATVSSPASFKIVPGDTVTYTKTFNVTATGDNLAATAALGATAITAASSSAADTALAAALTKSATFTVNGAATSSVVAAAGTQPVVVSVTITYPKSATAGAENSSKLGAASLSGFTITLTQN